MEEEGEEEGRRRKLIGIPLRGSQTQLSRFGAVAMSGRQRKTSFHARTIGREAGERARE